MKGVFLMSTDLTPPGQEESRPLVFLAPPPRKRLSRVKRPRAILPEVHLHEHGVWYQHLLALTTELEPIR